MKKLWGWLAAALGGISRPAYDWPGMDIPLPAERLLHLVGSIHMGTRDMSPLPASLMTLLRDARALVVEADITVGAPLTNQEPVMTPLAERLPPDPLATLRRLCAEYGLDEGALASLPAWHIALMLQARQAEELGLRAAYGIDYQLIQAAREMNIPIIELEGPDEQLDLLRQLPDQGNALLLDTLSHWHTNARLLQTMISWWVHRGPADIAKAFPSTFSGELYQYLMTERNRRWRTALQELPSGVYVVAVGALHLYGDQNLPSLLRQ
ncbi:conjugal transfer protein TraB [Martelella alba]|uniref:Conjugal transfer protein TraB n=2 Tax=Martelella alba TaxID=2590451 RepID=A0ABY2SL61_9HYPH|nr:conjugal transfer protein TraB [Martelella alba]